MGADEYHPISHRGSNFSIHGGVGYTVIDAIDTMYLMGLEEEYKRARHWIASQHTFDRNGNFNTFEVGTRWKFSSHVPSTIANYRRRFAFLVASFQYTT